MITETIPSTFDGRRSTGPLPSPKELAEYEQIVPGAGEKLLHLLEVQQKHRIEVEQAALRSIRIETRLGQLAAFLLAFFSLVAGVFLALRGIEVAGAIISTASLVMCLVAFIVGRVTQGGAKHREIRLNKSSDEAA